MFKLNTGVATRGHSVKILKINCRLELSRHYFPSELSTDGTDWISKLLTQ